MRVRALKSFADCKKLYDAIRLTMTGDSSELARNSRDLDPILGSYGVLSLLIEMRLSLFQQLHALRTHTLLRYLE